MNTIEIIADLPPVEFVIVGGGFVVLAIAGVAISIIMGIIALVRRGGARLREEQQRTESIVDKAEVQS